ncbi:MAG: ComF family protein [Clostridium sp.]
MGRRIFKTFKFIIECILDVIYPKDDRCIYCQKEYAKDDVCFQCKKDIYFLNEPFLIYHDNKSYKCYSIAKHKGVIRDLVMRLKYSSEFYSADILAKYLIFMINEKNIKADAVTFVPLSRKTYNKRGYNQAEVLAKKVAEKLGIPCKAMLKKVKETKDQIGLTSLERWQNIDGCFKFNYKKDVFEKVIVIDDVVTTGATIINCTKELKENGVKKVFILTVTKSIV